MASVRVRLVVLLLIGSLLTASMGALAASGTLAAPGQTTENQGQNQNVDYLGPDAAARLDLDFPVLVPSYVPGPFGGEPAVSAGGGFYSLYWMNVAATPTFLYVEGQVGGSLPTGSPADLNNELTVNASVQGNAAIHDVTATYDAVWWISGGVLYTVESRNMETDSLSLANSLVEFIAPVSAEPDPETPVEEMPPEAGGGVLEPPTDAPEEPVATDSAGDEGDDEPIATTEPKQAVVDDAVDPVTMDPTDGTGSVPSVVSQIAPTAVADPEPTAADVEELVEATEEIPEVEGDAGADEPEPAITTGETVGSDGTGGAPLPVFGGDGTGGTRDLTVPIPGE
ncbi:MAG TPA: hypothetical protein VGR08_00040 [Thermomicrobiales bacterium]|nr:hypothetical protein [Thermomicrobiales bacterium]